MTTIACNGREIAAEARCSLEGVGTDVFSVCKLFAINGAIYGVTGEDCSGSLLAIEWLASGANAAARPAAPNGAAWVLIELSSSGIAIYNTHLERDLALDRVLAVGSGRKVAMYCMRHLRMTPAEAVREACKVDHYSSPPIFAASLADPIVRRWHPPARKKSR